MAANQAPKRTEISELGEFGLINHLTKNVTLKNRSSLTGVGDDAAVIACSEEQVKVLTQDLLVEGVHFDLMYHPLRHLGYKAVAVNLSDIYAMNAWPEQITVGLGISNRFSVEALEELYDGILAACEKYGVDLVGGDTTSSQKGLIISISALGYAKPADIVYRHTAQAGDLIAVSGDLGGAYLGLQMLEREKQVYLENPEIKPNLEQENYIVGRQLLPHPRRDVVELLEEMNIKPTAMIDISDGLSSDLLHICNRSGVGCRIYEEKLPIAEETRQRAMKFKIAPSTCALNGGEDYELLFTLSPADAEKLSGSLDITILGECTKAKDGFRFITQGGQVHDLIAQGWQHA